MQMLVDFLRGYLKFVLFWFDFRREISEKVLKLTKKVINGSKKYFVQPLSARSTQKLVETHNIRF